MKHRWLWVSLLLTTALLGCCYLTRPQPGKVFEIWVSTGQPFKIRITAHQENFGFFVGGGWYKFEAMSDNAQQWQEIGWFRHDDPLPIQSEKVHFVTSQIGFVFMGWMYAVTTDAGKTWSVWNAKQDWPGWQCCNYELIKEVQLTDGGTGIMSVHVIDPNRGEVPKLYTSDYGRSWRKQP